jgi:ABC-type branched-subunit amino acid transport system substrate-binding protein
MTVRGLGRSAAHGRRWRPAVFLALPAAAAVLVSACGSSAKSGSSGSGGPQAQGITAKTITLGIDTVESGPLAPYAAGAVQFLQAYVDATNASGGVDGHQIKLIVLDDKGDPGQTLLNYETLWDQDHVAAMVGGGFTYPYAFIQKNNVPEFTAGGDPEAFSSKYPTIFINGGNVIQWGSETAYWTVMKEHKHPKVVAVIDNPQFAAWNSYITAYWHKLGVKTVLFSTDLGPTGNCNAYVLKWKAAGVDYIDVQGEMWPQCLVSEAQLGWKPALGQGGALTSQIGEANLIGAAMNGIIAGSPGLLHTGVPLYTTTPPAIAAFVSAIKKYAPQYATDQYLDGTIQFDYTEIEVAVDALKAAFAKYGSKFSTADLIKAAQGMTNIQTTIEPPIASFAPNCKTGADGTIWGYWHYNAATKTDTFVPNSGSQWITDDFFGFNRCYMTIQANKSFG